MILLHILYKITTLVSKEQLNNFVLFLNQKSNYEGFILKGSTLVFLHQLVCSPWFKCTFRTRKSWGDN